MTATATSVKLVLLGDSGVGKTSIATQYISGKAPQSVKPTIGAAFVTKSIVVDNQPVELLIWDTAGQEVYRGLAPMYYRSALIAIVVYDITRQQSYESVSYWINELKANADSRTVIVVCANKTDLEDQRAVEEATAQQYAESNGALYAATSAATGAGIDRMFQMAVGKLMKDQAGQNVANMANNKGVQLKEGQNANKEGCAC